MGLQTHEAVLKIAVLVYLEGFGEVVLTKTNFPGLHSHSSGLQRNATW